MFQISASLLAADYACLGDEMKRAEKAGVNSFHFDMMDGHYVPNLAFTPEHLRALRPCSPLPFNVHLELDNPDEALSNFPLHEASIIIVQWNTLSYPARTFDRIRSQNKKIGLGLTPDDTLENASRLFQNIDMLLILGVFPGFGGQNIQPGTQEKIARARNMVDQEDHPITIAVDGGVKPENAAGLVKAGADCLIMGTALFQSADLVETIRSLRGSIPMSPHR